MCCSLLESVMSLHWLGRVPIRGQHSTAACENKQHKLIPTSCCWHIDSAMTIKSSRYGNSESSSIIQRIILIYGPCKLCCCTCARLITPQLTMLELHFTNLPASGKAKIWDFNKFATLTFLSVGGSAILADQGRLLACTAREQTSRYTWWYATLSFF